MMRREPLTPPLLASLAAPLAGLLLASGCAGAPPPPEVPAAVAPTAPPAASGDATPPVASSAATAAPPPVATFSIPRPPPPAEPLAPLTRTFTTVKLPGVKRSIVSVEGRGPNDLWFMTYEEQTDQYARTVGGDVLHYDGKRIKSHGHPCPYSMFGGIVVSGDAVVALGYRPWSRGVAPSFRASLVKDSTWNCEEDRGGYSAGITTTSGDHVWELSCRSDDCRLEASGGPSVPLPSDHPSFDAKKQDAPDAIQAIWMRGLDDGWMVRSGDDGRSWLLRYNGVTWTAVAPLEEGMYGNGLWAEGNDVWILVGWSADDGLATDLLRYDGRSFSYVPVPKGFSTRRVRGASGRDLWFSGAGKALYQWDGAALHQGEGPFEVDDLWAGPGGEVWLVGPPTDNGGPPAGTVARALPLPAAGKVTP